jgi:hypothetical protein
MRTAILVLAIATASVGCASHVHDSDDRKTYCGEAFRKNPALSRGDSVLLEIDSRTWAFREERDYRETYTAADINKAASDQIELDALCECAKREEVTKPETCKAFHRHLREMESIGEPWGKEPYRGTGIDGLEGVRQKR